MYVPEQKAHCPVKEFPLLSTMRLPLPSAKATAPRFDAPCTAMGYRASCLAAGRPVASAKLANVPGHVIVPAKLHTTALPYLDTVTCTDVLSVTVTLSLWDTECLTWLSVSQASQVKTHFVYNSSDGYVVLQCRAGIMTMAWDFNKETMTVWNIGTVPEGFRPSIHTYTAASVPYSGRAAYDHMGGYMSVTVGGRIVFVPAYAASGISQCGCMSWPVA